MDFDFSSESVAATEAAVVAATKQRDGAFDMVQALRLLQLYQFYPALSRPDVVFLVLARALMTLPSASDFAACLALIPEKLIGVEPLSILVKADSLLETGEFEAFWTFVEPHRDALAAIPGFFEAVASFISCTLERTFRRMPRAALCSALHVDEGAVAGVLAAHGWRADGADVLLPEPAAAPKSAPHASTESATVQLAKVLSALQ